MNLGLDFATFFLAASNPSLMTIALLRRLLMDYNKYVTGFKLFENKQVQHVSPSGVLS
jgi:hypothetical protein